MTSASTLHSGNLCSSPQLDCHCKALQAHSPDVLRTFYNRTFGGLVATRLYVAVNDASVIFSTPLMVVLSGMIILTRLCNDYPSAINWILVFGVEGVRSSFLNRETPY